MWSGSKYTWCNALIGLMNQPVLDSNIKFTVSLTGAVTATLRALLFQQRICALVWVRAQFLRVLVSGPLLQSRAAVGLQAAPPSRLKNSTCLSVLPPVSHLPACFSLPPCPSRLPCCTSLVSLSQSGSLPARVTPPLPSYRPVCIRSPDMHHTH